MAVYKTYLKYIVAAVSISCLAGCQVADERVNIDLIHASAFADTALGVSQQELDKKFYTLFEDKLLNSYVETALLNNNTLKKAFLALKNSSLNLALIKDDSSFKLSGNLGVQNRRALDYHESFKNSSSSSLGLNYVLDVFAKNSYKEEAAEQELKASAFAYLNVRLGIIESVISAYLQRVFALEALSLARDDLKDSKNRLDLVQKKYKTGQIDALEYDRALLDYKDTQQNLYMQEHNLSQSSNALNALLGRSYDSYLQSGSLDNIKEPDFMLKLPLALLKSRADLQQASYNIKMALSDLKVAQREFFPELSVSVGINAGDGLSLGRLISNPVLSLGSFITLPFLNYNELRIKEKMKRNTLESYKVEFVELYVNALKECSDALNAQRHYKDSLIRAKSAYELSSLNYQRTLAKYKLGDMSLSDLLDAAAILRQKALAQKQMQFNLLLSQLDLMIALGGGVDKEDLKELYNSLDKS